MIIAHAVIEHCQLKLGALDLVPSNYMLAFYDIKRHYFQLYQDGKISDVD